VKSGRRRRKKRYAQNVLDFRPGIDRVVRRDGRGYVVDGAGLYQDLELDGDLVEPEAFAANVDRLTPEQRAGMFEAVRTTPWLSPEGRAERCALMLERGLVRLRFDVLDGPEQL
jgi:hypothetical protein